MLNIRDEKEYNSIVDEYSDMIFRIAYQNLFNIHDAEDVTQDVFLKLIKQKENFFNDKEHLKSWLIRVTINRSIDFKKAFFRKNTVPLHDIDIPFEPEEKELLEEMYQLPRDYRNILYLYYYEGYTIKEIANILGIKQNTVNSRLTRGRKKLKVIMEV
ncbi:MAG: RNA polymerase sigma factor [Anaerostipes sp.]|nr:RNA polymerase sigma factor [Anaerostipes sp.]